MRHKISVDSQGSKLKALKNKIKPQRNTKENQKFADLQHIMGAEDEPAETHARITKGFMINLF